MQGLGAAALERQNGLGCLPSTVPVLQTAKLLLGDKAEQPLPVKAELLVAAPDEQPAASNGAANLLVEGADAPQNPAPSELAKVRTVTTSE